MRLPAVVCLSWSFWNEDEDDNGTEGQAPVRFEASHGNDKPVAALPNSNFATVQLQDHMQSGLQEECWRSTKRWRTLISVGIKSDQTWQRVLQEFPGQRFLQECSGSAQRWLTSISSSIGLEHAG
jgi:hypothetical protein